MVNSQKSRMLKGSLQLLQGCGKSVGMAVFKEVVCFVSQGIGLASGLMTLAHSEAPEVKLDRVLLRPMVSYPPKVSQHTEF